MEVFPLIPTDLSQLLNGQQLLILPTMISMLQREPCEMTSWMGSYLSAGWKHWSLDPAWCSLQRRQFCPVASLWCCCLGVSSRSCWPGSICSAAVAPAVGSESQRKPLLPRGLPVVPSCECSGWENNTDLWKDPPSVWTAHIPQRTNEPRDDGLFFKRW